MKSLTPKFRLDLSSRLKDIAEKQVPAKLKLILSSAVQFFNVTDISGH